MIDGGNIEKNGHKKQFSENASNPKPWKKLHSKYVDEFVHKFCGFYPFESRPVAWKRMWHCNNTNTRASEMWPGILSSFKYI